MEEEKSGNASFLSGKNLPTKIWVRKQSSAGTIDSTSLSVTEREFLFRFFSPDQSFSQPDQSGIDCAVESIVYWNRGMI